MISDQPRPLPECALCQQPTQRRVHRRNGGLCTGCTARYDEARGQQTALLLPLEPLNRQGPDLTNVVVLRPREPRP